MPKKSILSKEGTGKSFEFRFFSNQKALNDLDWTPTVDLDDTITDSVIYLQSIGKIK